MGQPAGDVGICGGPTVRQRTENATHGERCQCLGCRGHVTKCDIPKSVTKSVPKFDNQPSDIPTSVPKVRMRECPMCAEAMPGGGRGRPRQFCSDRCKQGMYRQVKTLEGR